MQPCCNWIAACHGNRGCRDVQGCYRCIKYLSSRCFARPLHEHGHADSTLISGTFRTPQGTIVTRSFHASIVTKKPHHRVLTEPEFIDLGQQLTNAFIHFIDHRAIDGAGFRCHTGHLGHLVRRKLSNRFFRRLQIQMGGVVGHEKEERLFLILLKKANTRVGQLPCQILIPLNRFPVVNHRHGMLEILVMHGSFDRSEAALIGRMVKRKIHQSTA